MQQHPHTEGLKGSGVFYRAYRLNTAGHIMSAQWLHVDSDCEAKALRSRDSAQVELWFGSRRVASLTCPAAAGRLL